MLGKSLIKSAAGNAGVADPDFENTVLLLNGDGTNGGQNNTFLDSSSNAHTITRNGNATQGSFSPFAKDDGKWGVEFDASSWMSTSSLITFSGDFTIEFWVYWTEADDDGYTIILSTGGAVNNQFTIKPTGAVSLVLDNAVRIADSGTAVTSHSWHHVAYVRESGTCRIYVDGVQQGTGTYANAFSLNYICQYRSGGYELIGYLSNLRMVDGTCLYPSGTTFTPPTGPLEKVSGTQLLTFQSNRFVDNSDNAYTFTLNGTPKVTTFSPFPQTLLYSAGTNGGSGYFDGNGDYLTAPANTDFQFGSGDFTIEFFWYPTNLNQYQTPIDMGYANTGSYLIQNGSNGLPFFYTNSSGVVFTSATAYSLNSWNHLVVSRSGSTLSMFLNGTRTNTTTNSDNLNANFPLGMGGSPTHSVPYEIDGYLSNVRLVKGTAVYDPTQTSITTPSAPLTDITNASLLCNFTNASITDLTGSNVLETVGNAQVDTTTFKYGTGALEFDGTGDWLQTPDSDLFNFGTGDFTIECWAKIDTPLANFRKGIVGQTENVTGRWQVRPAQNSGYFGFTYYNGSVYRDMDGGAAIPDNTWCHLAVVREDGVFKFFIDGVKGTDNSSYTTESVGNSTGLYIMRNVWDNHDLAGSIDDLRITKGIARYTADFTPPQAALPVIGG